MIISTMHVGERPGDRDQIVIRISRSIRSRISVTLLGSLFLERFPRTPQFMDCLTCRRRCSQGTNVKRTENPAVRRPSELERVKRYANSRSLGDP